MTFLIIWSDEKGVRHWIDGATNWCNDHEHRIPPEDRVEKHQNDPRTVPVSDG